MQSAPSSEADTLAADWQRLQARLATLVGKPTITAEGMLLLIGIQEAGWDPAATPDKQQKQDLLHVGMCTILAPAGYYVLTHRDADGWPHFAAREALPPLDAFAQARFLQAHLLAYFRQVYGSI